jgi:DNA-binding Xre family transcriptional regulator
MGTLCSTIHRSSSTLFRLENQQQSVTLGRLEQILERLKCKLGDVFPEEFSR